MSSRHRPIRQLVKRTAYCWITHEQALQFDVPMRSLYHEAYFGDKFLVDRRRMGRHLRREYLSISADIKALERIVSAS